MCGLLSEIRVPLPGTNPSPSPTQMVGLLNWYKSSDTLIQTVLVTLLIYSSVEIHCPDISPLPAGRAHYVLLALCFFSRYIGPEELAGGPVTSWHSQLVLKHVILERAQSAV